MISTERISKAPFAFDTFVASDGGTRAHLKVQDGCDFMCTFCVIPAARGRSRPRQLENLLAEAESLAAQGAREIVLTGVNVGTYDHDGTTLLEVVDRLNTLAGVARIRISSIEPTTVQAGLLERMADAGHKLVPFLHLPLQSGAEDVLTAMRRRYTAADYRAFVEHALRTVPDLCLGTDVMVGFPGESDEAFSETFALLEGLPFAYFHVFPFSERYGTAAVRMKGSVPVPIRQRRAEVLRALSDAKRLAFHRAHLGRAMPVLLEKPARPDVAEGYTANYIRVQVAHADAAALRNQLRTVRLLEAGAHHVAGAWETGLPVPSATAPSSAAVR